MMPKKLTIEFDHFKSQPHNFKITGRDQFRVCICVSREVIMSI